ncbi:MAG: SGNH/GDSL hydrolase family protein [Clostridium sp.]|jgi:lysophospholipase L1-like esterase|nr:SGNH/GDSL hydrolase family protein [Clostridium sp.]
MRSRIRGWFTHGPLNLHGLTAVIFFLVLLGLYAWAGRQEKTVYSVVCFGDSLIGQIRDETSVPGLLEAELGQPVFNGAFGGTRMSRLSAARSLAYSQDGYSMAALAQAVAYGDFGVQQTLRGTQNGTFYFEETVDVLETIDYRQVDVIFIQHGVNDYHNGIPLRSSEDPYDVYTFSGAVRTVVRTLRENLPQARIILMTPTYCWLPDKRLTCEEWDTGYGGLEAYVAEEIRVAQELGVEIIDHYRTLFPHAVWEDWERYTVDGLHLNEDGRRLVAASMAAYLRGSPAAE